MKTIKITVLFLIGLFLGVLIIAATANAQQMQCGSYEEVKQVLAEKYGEVPVGLGLSARGYVLEVFAAPGGGSTILMVMPQDGIACLLDSGEGWQTAEPLRKGSL